MRRLYKTDKFAILQTFIYIITSLCNPMSAVSRCYGQTHPLSLGHIHFHCISSETNDSKHFYGIRLLVGWLHFFYIYVHIYLNVISFFRIHIKPYSTPQSGENSWSTFYHVDSFTNLFKSLKMRNRFPPQGYYTVHLFTILLDFH